MRARHEIRTQMYTAESRDEWLELQLELLLDIRELLQQLQPACTCAETKKDGESEHWPSCRYA